MKAIPTINNLDILQKNIADTLIYLGNKRLVFLDTNVLVWIYRLNEASFREISKLLLGLASDNDLVIPNWVVHEYNNLLIGNSEELFFPFKSKLKSLNKELDYLTELGKLTIDNEFSKKNGYTNKKVFINELSEDLKSLKKKIHLLSDKNNFKSQERRKFIEDLILKAQSISNVNKIIETNSILELRQQNNIPPGFKDKDKISNKFGDNIIWNEIIENCKKRQINKALFISLDVKIDWVYAPAKLVTSDREVFNNGIPKHYFIHPWLEEEFKFAINDGTISISNIASVINVLYSPDMNPIDFVSFKNLAKTVDIEMNNSDTNKVIEWLVDNGHKLHLLQTTICKYEYSPGEVDFEKFEEWCINNIRTKIDFNKVKWIDVFTNLFL